MKLLLLLFSIIMSTQLVANDTLNSSQSNAPILDANDEDDAGNLIKPDRITPIEIKKEETEDDEDDAGNLIEPNKNNSANNNQEEVNPSSKKLTSGHIDLTNHALGNSSEAHTVGHGATVHKGKLYGRAELGFLGWTSFVLYDKRYMDLFKPPAFGVGGGFFIRFRFHAPAYIPKALFLASYDVLRTHQGLGSDINQLGVYLGVEWSFRLASHLDMHISVAPGFVSSIYNLQLETQKSLTSLHRIGYAFASNAQLSFEIHILPSLSLHLGTRIVAITSSQDVQVNINPVAGFIVKFF